MLIFFAFIKTFNAYLRIFNKFNIKRLFLFYLREIRLIYSKKKLKMQFSIIKLHMSKMEK